MSVSPPLCLFFSSIFTARSHHSPMSNHSLHTSWAFFPHLLDWSLHFNPPRKHSGADQPADRHSFTDTWANLLKAFSHNTFPSKVSKSSFSSDFCINIFLFPLFLFPTTTATWGRSRLLRLLMTANRQWVVRARILKMLGGQNNNNEDDWHHSAMVGDCND